MPDSKLDVFESRVTQLSQMLAHYDIESDCTLPPPKVFDLDTGGKARVWQLYEDDAVSIVKSILDPNTEFPRHNHTEIEHIVLFKGYALFVLEDAEDGSLVRRVELRPGEHVVIPAGVVHRVITEDDGAYFSVTTVPRAEGLTG